VNLWPWFMDTGYLVALISERDELHVRAIELSVGLRRPLVTTEAVLLEVGNSLACAPLPLRCSLGCARIPQSRSSLLLRPSSVERSPSMPPDETRNGVWSIAYPSS
jgi:hypothetical protein